MLNYWMYFFPWGGGRVVQTIITYEMPLNENLFGQLSDSVGLD